MDCQFVINIIIWSPFYFYFETSLKIFTMLKSAVTMEIHQTVNSGAVCNQQADLRLLQHHLKIKLGSCQCHKIPKNKWSRCVSRLFFTPVLKYNVQEFKLMHVVIDLFGWAWTQSVNTDMEVGQPCISGCQQLQTFSCPHQTCLQFDCFFSLIKCQADRLHVHCAWQPADFCSSPNWPHNKRAAAVQWW